MCDAENNPQSGIDYILINEDFCHKFSGLCIRKIPGTHSEGCRCQTLDFLSFRVGYQIIKKAQWPFSQKFLQFIVRFSVKNFVREILRAFHIPIRTM